ncbi:MAG: TM2 domain-containing protein [Candidatus Kapabacteria bacterium]|nr:TM2 domain-containing protein [Candidatus Kapabacteria bacterium]
MKGIKMTVCKNCGAELEDGAVFCPKCGANQNINGPGVSEKEFITTLLLLLHLGATGAHRFYVGKTGTGVLYFFTLGCLGIGVLIDLINLLTGKFTDSNGKIVKNSK